jgi:hypothetical protein
LRQADHSVMGGPSALTRIESSVHRSVRITMPSAVAWLWRSSAHTKIRGTQHAGTRTRHRHPQRRSTPGEEPKAACRRCHGATRSRHKEISGHTSPTPAPPERLRLVHDANAPAALQPTQSSRFPGSIAFTAMVTMPRHYRDPRDDLSASQLSTCK